MKTPKEIPSPVPKETLNVIAPQDTQESQKLLQEIKETQKEVDVKKYWLFY